MGGDWLAMRQIGMFERQPIRSPRAAVDASLLSKLSGYGQEVIKEVLPNFGAYLPGRMASCTDRARWSRSCDDTI